MITETYETTFSWANYEDGHDRVQAEAKIGDYYFYEVSIAAGDPNKPDWIQTRIILAKDAADAKKPFMEMWEGHVMNITIKVERAKVEIPQVIREDLNKGG